MPFVNISLARGKSGEYLEAVSRAVHNALVAELAQQEGDPGAFGRFVIEVDDGGKWRSAGTMGFKRVNERSRIAHLERLAVPGAGRVEAPSRRARGELVEHGDGRVAALGGVRGEEGGEVLREVALLPHHGARIVRLYWRSSGVCWYQSLPPPLRVTKRPPRARRRASTSLPPP